MLLHGVRRVLSADSSMMPTPVHIGTVIRNARVFNFKKSSAETMDTEALLETVVRLFTVLQTRQIDYLLVGGVAMLQYVQGRNTEDIDLIVSVSALQVVLENNNGHLTQLSAERRPLFRALLPSRQEVPVSCPWAGPGEPGSAAGQSGRSLAW